MVTAEVPNGIRGARFIDYSGYIVEIIQGKAYVANKNLFLEIATPIQAQTFNRDVDLARRFLMENLATDPVAKEGRATLMLARPIEGPPGEYIGFGMQREILIPTSQGNVDVLYTARTILEGHRKNHLGRFFSQAALALHPNVDMIGYRTQNPASVWSNYPVVKEKQHLPFDKTFEKDRLAQEAMIGLWWRVRRYGREVNWVTGVSKGDLGEENLAYVPDPNHAPTMRILEVMMDRLRMNFARGDSVIALGYV